MPVHHCYLPLVEMPEIDLCHPGKIMTYTNFRDQNRKSEFAEIRETLLSPAYF